MASSSSNVVALAIRGTDKAEKTAVRTGRSDEVKEVSDKPEFEKIIHTYGCVAGSGSSSIFIYNKHRATELARLEKMDKDWDSLKSAEAFQAKREAQMAADDAKTEKNRAKRQKRKENKKTAEVMKKEADGVNKFTDGNFLEMMMKMDPKELEREAAKAKEEAIQSKKEAAAAKASVVTVAQMSSAQNITIRDDDF
eukprot:TRINITY_DN113948_c0_g1_i1.p1 TRINITY_DN113948_c0_g1~~TRINITY_DN113948_c0_g1_i1.p1  ORF type:complete len:196 (-),score=78.80 TRINITY_DN113948_c0_g1_i1:331-918(-)